MNSELLVDHTSHLGDTFSRVQLSSRVGLLYPGAGSRLLDDLVDTEHPDQLVVLDGTWHHTKTLFRDIPRLQTLPKFRIAPLQPSQYLIRREPEAQCLSTLEATVAALKCLEPETAGLDKLLESFVGMIQSQLTLPQADFGARRHYRRKLDVIKNIPKAIRDDLENIVIVYGETSPGYLQEGRPPEPVYWVAQRLVSSERFEQAIRPASPLSQAFLNHVELPSKVFDQAISIEKFLGGWETFLRPTDTIAFYYPNVAKLLARIGGPRRRTVHLKSVQFEQHHKSASLNEVLTSLGVTLFPTICSGRAGKRLASSIAFTHYLHEHTKHRMDPPEGSSNISNGKV